MEQKAKEEIKKYLPIKSKYTDFDIFKARKTAIEKCTDDKLKEELNKVSYSGKDYN